MARNAHEVSDEATLCVSPLYPLCRALQFGRSRLSLLNDATTLIHSMLDMFLFVGRCAAIVRTTRLRDDDSAGVGFFGCFIPAVVRYRWNPNAAYTNNRPPVLQVIRFAALKVFKRRSIVYI